MDDRDFEAPWFEWQPSVVPVFFHPTERATRLVELKQLGQKVSDSPGLSGKISTH
jgi:hypothetical protein